jgi:DNA replication protein DnaD
MSRAVFNYTIEILQKVSFNSELFQRELEKSLANLLPLEIEELKIWLKSFTADKPELRDCLQLVL